MADGDVKYRFMADAAAAERAIAQLEKKYDQLEQKIKGVARTSKKSKDDEISLFQRATQAAGSYAVGLVGISTAVQVGTAMWERYARSVDEVAKRQEALNKAQATGVVEMGLVGGGARLKQFTESIPGVLPEQALAAFKGVQAGIPQGGIDRQEEIARAVSAMAPALAPVDASGALSDTGKLSEFAEATATLSQFFEGKGVGDLADLAIAVQGSIGNKNLSALRAGGYERAITDMIGRGMTPEMALATASVGIDEGYNIKSLRSESEIAKLDQGRIAGLAAGFANAQQTDAAQRLLQDVFAVNPNAFVNQSNAAAGLANFGPTASEGQAIDIMQQERWANAQGFFQSASALVREPIEEVGFQAMKMMGIDTGAPQALQMKSLEEMQKQTALLQQMKPPIRRDAQTE